MLVQLRVLVLVLALKHVQVLVPGLVLVRFQMARVVVAEGVAGTALAVALAAVVLVVVVVVVVVVAVVIVVIAVMILPSVVW